MGTRRKHDYECLCSTSIARFYDCWQTQFRVTLRRIALAHGIGEDSLTTVTHCALVMDQRIQQLRQLATGHSFLEEVDKIYNTHGNWRCVSKVCHKLPVFHVRRVASNNESKSVAVSVVFVYWGFMELLRGHIEMHPDNDCKRMPAI